MHRQASLEVCSHQCGAKCCRNGVLPLTPTENALGFEGELREDGNYRYEMSGDCKFLVNNECSIYTDRPMICRQYPTKPTAGCLVWPGIRVIHEAVPLTADNSKLFGVG